MVKLNPTRIDYSQFADDGRDIRFLDSDDQTLLSYEIEKWTKDGESFIWVKVPQIDSGSTSDFIYMYWGNKNSLSGENKSSVWDGNFKMVQHLKEISGQHYDSTVNDNNSTTVNVTNQGNTSGKINGADSFGGLTAGNYIQFGSSPYLSTRWELSAWIYVNRNSPSSVIVGRTEDNPWRHNYYFEIAANGSFYDLRCGYYNGSAWTDSSNKF